jgi:hypothetical protein
MVKMALVLVALIGPNGEEVDINPGVVVSLRAESDRGMHHSDVQCVIRSTDGLAIGVRETCDEVRRLLSGQKD